MKIILKSHTLSRSELEAGLSLTRAFFPEARVEVEDELHRGLAEMSGEIGIIQMEINYPDIPWYLTGTYLQPTTEFDQMQVIEAEIHSLLSLPYVGKETSRKLLLKRGLFELLSKVTGHRPPWGTLTGIRPSKILHRLMDRGYSSEAREGSLRDLYGIRGDKVQLLQEIVSIQRPFLESIKGYPNQVALYIGIPFCPTRCSYCSFPAYSLKQGRLPLESYLVGLREEIQITGEWMREVGLVADSIYLGGGTPTILTTPEISGLISLVKNNIPIIDLNTDKAYIDTQVPQIGLELTVEAGRPDTLSLEKLLALRESGVNRLSINPQTMHNVTLRRIGRDHTVEDILRIYELARKIPGWTINMDLIIGLPGEGLKNIQETLEQVRELNPDNLTAHALAIKRGSKEYEQGLIQNLDCELEAMQEAVIAGARSMGMRPYYLYRQKHIAGNLENIGFAKPGSECRYNIGIMEEHQNVIGLGAGASSKIVNPRDISLVNFQHPANWQAYLERWRNTHHKRIEMYL